MAIARVHVADPSSLDIGHVDSGGRPTLSNGPPHCRPMSVSLSHREVIKSHSMTTQTSLPLSRIRIYLRNSAVYTWSWDNV